MQTEIFNWKLGGFIPIFPEIKLRYLFIGEKISLLAIFDVLLAKNLFYWR
jgi:hypothetical protein